MKITILEEKLEEIINDPNLQVWLRSRGSAARYLHFETPNGDRYITFATPETGLVNPILELMISLGTKCDLKNPTTYEFFPWMHEKGFKFLGGAEIYIKDFVPQQEEKREVYELRLLTGNMDETKIGFLKESLKNLSSKFTYKIETFEGDILK